MKNIALALAFLAAFAVSAHAADPYNPEVPESYDAPVYAFTGLAVGIDGGGQFNAIQLNDGGNSFDGISADGLIGGAHLEYLFAVDRARIGGYAEGGFSNVNTAIETGGPSGDLLTQDSYYGAGLKVGVTTYGSTLLFARVGYDWSQWTAGEAFGADIGADVGSWLIGGGVDAMVSDHVSLGVGVDYLIVNDVEAAGTDLTDLFEESEMIRAKVRLTYHF